MVNKVGCFLFIFVAFLIYISVITEIPFFLYFVALIIIGPILINIFSFFSDSSNNNKTLKRLEYEKENKIIKNVNFIKKEIILKEEKISHNDTLTSNARFSFLKILIIGVILSILITFGTRKKIGAYCKDGTESYSIGSGTCSHHDGVKKWKYEYWWE